MLAVSTTPFNLFLTRKANVWYTVNDGNWSDPNTWMSNALDKKNMLNPQVGDTVYINHNVTLDISAIHVKHMYISGSIIGTASPSVVITIDGDCQVGGGGLITLQSQFHNLILNGYNNIIPYGCFNAGSYSTVTYNCNFDQFILNIPYRHLTVTGGQKYQASDISIAGNFNQQSNYECSAYNLTVNGSSTLGTVGSYSFTKNSSTGSILFIGSVDCEGTMDLSVGNPNVEFRGGITVHTFKCNPGSGTFTFSTSNQTLNHATNFFSGWSAAIVVEGAITLTLTGNQPLIANNSINGTVGSSTFNNEGVLYLGLNSTPMTTGVFNYQHTTASTMGYVFNGNFTLPYTSYANLVVDGTGIKSQSGNTTIGQTLKVGVIGAVTPTYECNGYNLTVNGQLTNAGNFTANAYCNILLIGLAQWNNGPSGGVDLSMGNPDVEFRGSLTLHSISTITGTGNFKFTTNNQTIDINVNNGGSWNANILVSGAISVTFIDGANSVQNFIYGTINGDNANSIFINKGLFVYANAQQPMQTGKLYCNQGTNTFIYGLAGNQSITVPSDPTSPGYQNLTLNNSGVKMLLGNVSVKGTYTLNSPATLNINGYTLTNP